MTYYIFLDNGKLNGCGQCRQLTEGVENIEVTKDVYNLYNETPDKYIYSDGEIVENPDYEQIQQQILKDKFKEDFFEIEGYGWYRKQPKGYTSAIESLNVVANFITFGATIIPAGTLIFYQIPQEVSQFTEEWLIENQIKSEEMNATEFANFYMKFTQAWNNTEHK